MSASGFYIAHHASARARNQSDPTRPDDSGRDFNGTFLYPPGDERRKYLQYDG